MIWQRGDFVTREKCRLLFCSAHPEIQNSKEPGTSVELQKTHMKQPPIDYEPHNLTILNPSSSFYITPIFHPSFFVTQHNESSALEAPPPLAKCCGTRQVGGQHRIKPHKNLVSGAGQCERIVYS